MEKLYKVLGKNGESVNGGHGSWKRNCRWMPPIEGELIPCKNGYHLCRKQDLFDWFGPTIWEAKYRGERLDSGNKVVVREARLLRQLMSWDETTARLFAIDCAERVMHLGDKVILSSVLAVVYLFAIGEATGEELDAARDAARTVAWSAVKNTATKEELDTVKAAAWNTARTVAWSAARDTARCAAWDAAWDAERNVTGDIAKDTAWDTAWAAEREWQTKRLFEYLGGK